MTKEEWFANGKELFGDDILKWRFVCPNCGNVQTPEDFRKYKSEGATPDSAYFKCIGRYDENCKGELGNGISPCNYTSGGLFNLNPVEVITEDGKKIKVFDFEIVHKQKIT